MPRSPEEAEKAADKLKLEGDARAAFVSRLTAGYVAAEALAPPPPAPKVEAPKAEASPPAAPPQDSKPKATTQPKPKYSALGETRPKTSPPPDGPVLGPEPPPAPPAASRYAAMAPSAPAMRPVPITNEELGESEVLSNEALGESQQPPPRMGPGRPGEAPRYVPRPVPAQMADVRKGDAAVYRREAPRDTYFRMVPEDPNLGESEVEVPSAPMPQPPAATQPAKPDTFRADYDFLLSRGYPKEKLDEIVASEGAKGISDRATYWRSR